MIVGSASFGDVVDAVRPVAERVGRPISPTVYGAKESRFAMAYQAALGYSLIALAPALVATGPVHISQGPHSLANTGESGFA